MQVSEEELRAAAEIAKPDTCGIVYDLVQARIPPERHRFHVSPVAANGVYIQRRTRPEGSAVKSYESSR